MFYGNIKCRNKGWLQEHGGRVCSGRINGKCHLIRADLHTNNRLIRSAANDASRNIWRQATSVPGSLGSNAEGDPPEDLTRASECVWDYDCCADSLVNIWGT